MTRAERGLNPKKYYKPRPISPRSVITVREDNPGPHRSLLGLILRVGYYSKQDGTNVVWLVFPNGEYQQATSQAYINRHFRIIHEGEDPDSYGDERPILQPLTDAEVTFLATQGSATTISFTASCRSGQVAGLKLPRTPFLEIIDVCHRCRFHLSPGQHNDRLNV